jgi:hypothetical protein
MPSQPHIQSVHVNRPLTNILTAYMNQRDQFVATSVFPTVAVSKVSDGYYKYDKKMWLRDQTKMRAAGEEAAQVGFTVSTDSYVCQRIAAKTRISDPERANADAPINLETDKTEFIGHTMMLGLERRWATQYWSSGVWSTDVTGSSWNNSTASNPIAQILDKKEQILQNTGLEPNTLTLGAKCFRYLQLSTSIVDRIKYGQTPGSPAIVNRRTLAALFGVERVIVPQAVHTETNEASTAPTFDFVANPGHALLSYSPPAPGLRVPSAGYTFVWNVLDNSRGVEGVKMYRDESHESDIIEGGFWHDFKVVGADLGVFFVNAVGSTVA